MSRICTLVGLLFLLALPAWGERPRPLGWAMDAASRGEWDTALRIAERDGPVARDVIEWMRLREGLGTFDEVVGFLDRRPDWPGEPLLRRRSEGAVINQPNERVLAFFDEHPPATAGGMLAYARALKDNDQSGDADANIVIAWRTMRMSEAEHQTFLRTYKDLLKPHHVARLDAMLWLGSTSSARRMFELVDEGNVALAKARLILQNGKANPDAAIKAIPETMMDDPGLARDRFDWRMSKGRRVDAKALMLSQSRSLEALGRPEFWSNRRRSLARSEMREGDPEVAYQLASQHFLVEGSHYADLEWLSGYIALQYLNDPELALLHFSNHRAAVRSSISLGRAGYWIGRAHEAAGARDQAQAAYADGARHQTSFYGLLAAERGGFAADPGLAGDEDFGNWRSSEIVQRDLFQAGLLLMASGHLSLGERYWTHFAESLDRTQAGLLGQAAIEIQRPHVAVMIGKRVAQRGIALPAAYYALHPMIEQRLSIAPEMALAIARRESEFDPVVRSPVGARGLMQIMPTTGREVAQALGVKDHSTERLSTDPEYNARLGTAYLAQLARRFDGNVVLVSAGYNAGPSRPIRWMGIYGDPRNLPRGFDVVDWIEHIPFRETRNYVMRVAESLPVYRARLGLDPLPVPFSTELTGSTLKPLAPEGE